MGALLELTFGREKRYMKYSYPCDNIEDYIFMVIQRSQERSPQSIIDICPFKAIAAPAGGFGETQTAENLCRKMERSFWEALPEWSWADFLQAYGQDIPEAHERRRLLREDREYNIRAGYAHRNLETQAARVTPWIH